MEVSCPSCARRNRVPAKRLNERAKCADCKAALLPLARPVPLASEQDFDELVREAQLPVLVDFWAAWCGPCRMVAPEMEKIARAQAPRVIVAKVDSRCLLSSCVQKTGAVEMEGFAEQRDAGEIMFAATIASRAVEPGSAKRFTFRPGQSFGMGALALQPRTS